MSGDFIKVRKTGSIRGFGLTNGILYTNGIEVTGTYTLDDFINQNNEKSLFVIDINKHFLINVFLCYFVQNFELYDFVCSKERLNEILNILSETKLSMGVIKDIESL